MLRSDWLEKHTVYKVLVVHDNPGTMALDVSALQSLRLIVALPVYFSWLCQFCKGVGSAPSSGSTM
jgi:hypothetical protein